MLREAWSLRESEQWERMLQMADEARLLSEQSGFNQGVPRALALRAFVHYIRSDFRTALSECIEALHLAAGDAEAECRTRSVLSMVHWSLGNYEEALKNGERSIELMEVLGDRVTMAFAFAVKGGILLSLGETEEALAWHKRSLEAFSDLPDESIGRTRALSGLGLTYLAQRRHDEALATLLQALELARRVNHRITISRTLNDLGEVFEALDDDVHALEYHTEALEIRQKEGYRQAETTSLLAIGRVLARRGEHERAIELLERGLAIAEELGVRPRSAQCHHLLADVYQVQGQLAKALHHFMAADKVRSSLDVDQAALRYKAIIFEQQIEQLQRNAELESMASLGGLVGAIAHEVNSPLGAIQSSAQVTALAAEKLTEHDGRTAAALKTNAQVILEASHRISELVIRLKLLAGIDQAKYSIIDIGRAVRDVVALLRPEFESRVDVLVECEQVPPLYAYSTELYQVFLNLLRNAVQAIEGAGSVSICIRADAEKVTVAFTDTGRGIAPDLLPQIFTPSFRSTSGRIRASLSLFSCRLIARRHGGDVLVESQTGKGSTFTVVLPRSLERSDPGLEAA
ncbi:MAG TPA: tetratricopeptide repeat-containing sensor histidine kinase [Bryobacteraceae bacterium]|nr:tetratricopeptide repeat-containing sensor histidine kinase [Bryobacteraceae bacterium]